MEYLITKLDSDGIRPDIGGSGWAYDNSDSEDWDNRSGNLGKRAESYYWHGRQHVAFWISTWQSWGRLLHRETAFGKNERK